MNTLLTLALAAAQLAAPEQQVQDTLSEVTIVATRKPESKARIPQQVLTLTATDIAQANTSTTADLLAQTGMVAVQRSQQGGGSPMLRGFESSRVMLVVDGIRLNNLIYRSGHLQNIITVDQSMLERAEVLYGSSSVAYGSGALGGVMAFRTKQPTLATPAEGRTPVRCQANTFLRYGSANNETTGHIDLNIGGRRFASLTSFTYSNFGDLRAGNSKNPFLHDDSYIHRLYTVHRADGKDLLVPNEQLHRQPGSGYQQWDLMQKFLYRPNDRFSHTLNVQLSNSTDVPRYDRLTDLKGDKPKFAEWYYGPQLRLLTAYHLQARNWLGADHVTFTAAYQRVEESRHNRKLNDPWRGNRMEGVDVVSLNADWVRQLHPEHQLHVGIDGALSFLNSTAYRTNVDTDEQRTLDTRYPDGANHMHHIDLYALHRWDINPRLALTDGARVGVAGLFSSFHSDEYFAFLSRQVKDVRQLNATYSFDLGLNYRPTDDWRLAASFSTGYYVPNIDDVGKVFDSQPGMVVVPNPDVNPEQTLGLDLGVTRLQTGRVLWEATLFATYLFDAITLRPHNLNGADQVMYDGELSRVYANHNAKRAYVLGANTRLNVKLGAGFAADARATYTYGKIIDGEDQTMPLDHIAPLFGRVGVTYQHKRFFGECYSLFNGKKPLSQYNLNGEDNIGYATTLGVNGQGLPAWFTLNVRASYQVHRNTTLQLAAENLLDTQYRIFGSGINAPGRSLTATLRVAL